MAMDAAGDFVVTWQSSGQDGDGDGIPDDGDGTSSPVDNPCLPGQLLGCDDNCTAVANPGQADLDKDGKKVEIYFDPATGAELERK